MVTRPTALGQAGDVAKAEIPVPLPKSPNPLLTVTRWELRRALGGRSTWITMGLLVLVLVLLLAFSALYQFFDFSPTMRLIVTRNSLFGLAMLLPVTLIVFGLFLPFVTVDGASIDLPRRTHELLMTTPLQSRAYIWGRYLASLALAFGVALIYLIALLVVSVALHLFVENDYPALDLPGALVIWAAIVLPPTLLLSSLCFAAGVVLPKRSNQIKAGAVVAWFMVGLVLAAYASSRVRDNAAFDLGSLPAWWTAYETWQPTNTDAGHLFMEQFLQRFNAAPNASGLSDEAIRQRVAALQMQMPDLGSFVGAHLVWIVVGVAVVAGASFTFRRFRGVLA
jgi:hypothetical protein